MSDTISSVAATAGMQGDVKDFERRDLSFGNRWSASWLLGILGVLMALNLVLFFFEEPANGYVLSMGFTLALAPLMLLSCIWPLRRLIVLVMGIVLFHVAWSMLFIARYPYSDLLGLSVSALLNSIAYGLSLGPAVLYRGHVAARTNSMFHGRFDIKIAEHRDLQSWNNCVVDHQKTLQREVDSISEAFDFMKQIVGTMESDQLYRIVRDRLKSSFNFSRGYLAAFNTEETDSPAILEIQSLSEEKKAAAADVPEEIRVLIDAMASRVKAEDKEKDRTVVLEHVSADGSILSCELVSGGRPVGALAIDKLELIGGGAPEERDFRLGLLARQLGLGLDKTLLYRRVQAMAMTDNLTGLYVAWYFHQRLEEECQRSAEDKSHAPLLMLDVDHFKRFNDTHGHSAGDEVLKTVAGIIKATLREVDFVSRYGGEEFGIILPEISHETAHMIAERLRSAIANYDKLPYGKLTVSVGLATFPLHAKSKADLLAAADAALYQAKRTGRNRVCTAPELAG